MRQRDLHVPAVAADDLAFWRAARHHERRRVASPSSRRTDGRTERRSSPRRSTRGLQVVDLIGLGPFHLADPTRWDAKRERLLRAIDTAVAVGAGASCSRPDRSRRSTWEEAADALEAALAPGAATRRARRGIDFALEHTNSLRVDVGFVHTLRDAVDLARRLGTGVCMEVNVCWAERGLDGDDPRAASTGSASYR